MSTPVTLLTLRSLNNDNDDDDDDDDDNENVTKKEFASLKT